MKFLPHSKLSADVNDILQLSQLPLSLLLFSFLRYLTSISFLLPLLSWLSLQLSVGKEMVTTQEASNRTGTQTRLEGILGMPEGHHASLLSLWFAWGSQCGGGAKAFNYCGRRNYAADTGASEARLYILSEHSIWRCVSVPGTLSGKWAKGQPEGQGGGGTSWRRTNSISPRSPSSVRLSCAAIRKRNQPAGSGTGPERESEHKGLALSRLRPRQAVAWSGHGQTRLGLGFVRALSECLFAQAYLAHLP